jgi:hypothetical protein
VKKAILLSCLLWSTAGAAHALTLTSSTHSKSIFYDFSAPAIPFVPYAIPNGLPSGAKFSRQNGALKITNAWAGSFGFDTKLKPFDANQLGHLFFDYQLSPGVKVNLFFRVKGKYHGVVFSGPERVRPGSVMLGTLENIKADGKWHQAHVPLRDWLRRLYPKDETLPVEEVIVGNWDNTNYLMAGFGGNGPGVSWMLDNFALVGAENAAGEAKFELKDDKGAALTNLQDYVWTLDDGEETPLRSASLAVKAGDGLHWLRVRPKKGSKSTSDGAYAFWISSSPPRIGAPSLQNNTLSVPLAASAGADLRQVKLVVGDQNYDFTSPHLAWEGGELRLAAGAAGLHWKDGHKVEVKVEGLSDVLGRAAPPKTDSFAVDFSRHTETPSSPAVKLATTDIAADDGTFENGLDQWASEGEGGAIVERDSSTAASGRYAVRLTSPANAAPFRAAIRRTPFDAGRYPIITFDYKIPAALRVDFLLWFQGKPYSIQFTDKDNPWPKLGKVGNVVADEKWHQAEIPIAAMLRQIAPTATDYKIDWLSIGDMGWMGNSRGLQYWIDNFRFVPIERGAPLQASVQLADVTGTKAISWLVDDRADTVPSTDKSTSGSTFEIATAGRKWLHVRAQNGAGVWSGAVHMPLWLDGQTPQVSLVSPATETRGAPTAVIWELSDDLALDPTSLAVQVSGKDFTTQNGALNYQGATRRLEWNATAALANGLTSVADGTLIEWKLRPVRDYAGNASPEQSGAFIWDYAQDKHGPVVAVNSETHPSLVMHDFEGGLATWAVMDGSNIQIVPAAGEGAAPNNRVLRISNALEGSAFAVTAYPRDFDASKWNVVSFSYRIPDKANLAMRVRLSDGRAWNIRLRGESNDSLGVVPGIKADNTWRQVTFDLLTFLRRDQKINLAEIKGIDFHDPLKKTPANVVWEIDNFSLSQAMPGAAKLRWQGLDFSGARKYRVAWDQQPNAMPAEETTETSRTLEGANGTWFLHVQAEDGAGNWGPVTHYPVVIR